MACVLVMFIAFCQPVLAQRQLIDSLKTTLAHPMADTTRANTYYDIAYGFYKASQPDSSTYYLKQMQQLCLRKNYLAGLGQCKLLGGIVAMQQGLFDEALTLYQSAIKVGTRANRWKSIARAYNNLGWMYKMMGDSQHVLAYTRQGVASIQQAIAINQRLNEPLLLISNYINLGILHEDLGEMKIGRDCFFKALALDDQFHGPLDDYRILYNNLGKNYSATGQHEEAIEYINKALAINLKLKRYSSLAHNYRNMSTAYVGLKQPDRAVQYGKKALEYVKLSKDIPLTINVYKVLAQTYATAGHYEEAYTSVLAQKQLEDSLINVEKTRTIARLQGQYQVQQANELATIRAGLELDKTREIAGIEAKKAKEMAVIQAEENRRIAQIKARAEVDKARAVAELQTKYDTQKRVHQISVLDQQNNQRSRQLQYMTGGVGLLLLLLSLLVGQYQVIRRTNRQLSAQNQVITVNSQQLVSQSDQLRTLMKELHHRVKNNLAIVSSLLNLQVSGLHDEKAIQAVRVGQQRVEAMSLIHQRLYQTDQLTVVDMRAYLTDLAQSLMQAYGYQADAFRLQLDIDKQELDVDIAIPLGLIVNELVTNAFKYAYIHQQHPLLRIGLHRDKDPLLSGLTLEVQDNGPASKPPTGFRWANGLPSASA